MRVSTQHTFDFFVSQIQAAQSRVMDAEKQVLSGMKFEVASESPSGEREQHHRESNYRFHIRLLSVLPGGFAARAFRRKAA